MYEELRDQGLVVISVAVDRSADAARPWIDAAHPTHPSLVDIRHRLADLYNMVNVPTVVWIDERGKIARPNDVAFGTDTFRHITGIQAATHQDALRGWVRGELPVMSDDEVRALQSLPTESDQAARAEFGLGQWLHEQGRAASAARHFVAAGELAPHDFMIRRGTMPMRGIDPMGPEFRSMILAWGAAGNAYYRPLPG